MNSIVQTGIQTLSKLDDAAVAVRKDNTFSPVGRAQQLQPQIDKAKADIGDRMQRVQVEQQRIHAARAAIFAPPALDPTDAVGAALDREIRDRFGTLNATPNGLANLKVLLLNGGNERVLQALLRDPFDSPGAEFARSVWAERVTKSKQAELATLEANEQAAQWAGSTLTALGSVLDHAAASLSNYVPPNPRTNPNRTSQFA